MQQTTALTQTQATLLRRCILLMLAGLFMALLARGFTTQFNLLSMTEPQFLIFILFMTLLLVLVYCLSLFLSPTPLELRLIRQQRLGYSLLFAGIAALILAAYLPFAAGKSEMDARKLALQLVAQGIPAQAITMSSIEMVEKQQRQELRKQAFASSGILLVFGLGAFSVFRLLRKT